MRCPYLSSASKKECIKMLAEKIDEELTEFDLKHFCDGNPVYCYYFRLPFMQAAARLPESKVAVETLPDSIPFPEVLTKDASARVVKVERSSCEK